MHHDGPPTDQLVTTVTEAMIKRGAADAKQQKASGARSTAPFEIDAVNEQAIV